MGSPLGPILANIFVGYYETQLFNGIQRPSTYFRYVDDTFVIVKDLDEKKRLQDHLNNMHPSLTFTSEVEDNNKLAFLDVLVSRNNTRFVTTVYRKPTFTGLYTSWDSFCSKRRKISIITTLTHRALMICSEETLHQEVEKIKELLLNNGYPTRLTETIIQNKIKSFTDTKSQTEVPKKALVYLKLPYIGSISEKFGTAINNAVSKCFDSVTLRVHLVSRPMLKTATKDVLPTNRQSSVLYRFTCSCDSSYIGKTSRRLQDRINEHVPPNVRKTISQNPPIPPRKLVHSSAIAEHLLNNPGCGKNYHQDMFEILAQARSPFHLSILESLYITYFKPILCKQKQFVYSTVLFK